MRTTVPRSSEATLADLTAALDRDEQPLAETWRLVSAAMARKGLPHPSYANVRRLALTERRRRAELRALASQTLADLGGGRAPSLGYTPSRLRDAAVRRAVEPRVSETQGFEGG